MKLLLMAGEALFYDVVCPSPEQHQRADVCKAGVCRICHLQVSR